MTKLQVLTNKENVAIFKFRFVEAKEIRYGVDIDRRDQTRPKFIDEDLVDIYTPTANHTTFKRTL